MVAAMKLFPYHHNALFCPYFEHCFAESIEDTCCFQRASKVHKSSIATNVLKEKQVLLNLPEHKLKIDVSARWNSSYEMIERYLEQQPAVHAAMLSKEIRKSQRDLATFADSDLSVAEDILGIMRPMKIATVALSEDTGPTISMVNPLYHKLLQDLSPKADDSTVVRDMKQVKTEPEDAQYGMVAEEPPLPMLQLPDDRTTPQEDQGHHDTSHTSDSSDSSPEKKKIKHEILECGSGGGGIFCEMFGDTFITKVETRQKSAVEMAQDEILRYQSTETPVLTSSPLRWWDEISLFYPRLSKLAKRYLNGPSTSVPSERVFSTASDVVTAQRFALKPKHVNRLIFLKKNLKLN
ncbi:zinc finger BED domain-containing protein 4-like [Haliotis cracherodii]|uniref:zinc finger BED domain-containing protein 4-like n=1 Tax=Haliotis cracherodii TaxID=6455 RepID=UPI0039E8B655